MIILSILLFVIIAIALNIYAIKRIKSKTDTSDFGDHQSEIDNLVKKMENQPYDEEFKVTLKPASIIHSHNGRVGRAELTPERKNYFVS